MRARIWLWIETSLVWEIKDILEKSFIFNIILFWEKVKLVNKLRVLKCNETFPLFSSSLLHFAQFCIVSCRYFGGSKISKTLKGGGIKTFDILGEDRRLTEDNLDNFIG